MTDAREYLRAGDIARLTGVSLRTARRWIAGDTLPSVKVGGGTPGAEERPRTDAVAGTAGLGR